MQTVHTSGTDAEPCVLVAIIDKEYEVVAGLDGIVNWAGLSPPLNLFTVTEQDKGIEGTINIGYARACRHYTDKAKDCFSKFNP